MSKLNIQKGRLMNINKFLVTGHQMSGYESVANVLNSGGMQPAKPSSREGMTPMAISETLLKSYQSESDRTRLIGSEVGQLSVAPVWNGLALDLMLGNIDQEFWYWADAKAISLLDYWKSLDTQLAFVLVYDNPRDFIAQAFGETESVTPDALKAGLEEWSAYNKTLLKFYHRNADRALLVNAGHVRANGARYLQHVRSQTGLPLITDAMLSVASETQESGALFPCNEQDSDKRDVSFESSAEQSALNLYLAEELLLRHPDVMQLYMELQSVADLPADESRSTLSVFEAWSSAVQMKNDHRQKLQAADEEAIAAQQENQALAERLLKAKREREEQAEESELLLNQLHAVQEKLEQQFVAKREETISLKQAMDILKKEKAEQQNRVEQLSKENQAKQIELEEKNGQLATFKTQNEQTIKEKDAVLQNSKEAEEVKSENELLLAQLHIVQEELEQYYLENTKLKKEEQKRKAKPYGAAERVKNQLSYRLGAKMIENSRSFGGWVTMPLALMKETRQFRREFAERSKKKLPPISHYADAYDAERVKKHLSYRLGRVMVEKSRSPIGLVTLPLALRRAVKEYRRDRANV